MLKQDLLVEERQKGKLGEVLEINIIETDIAFLG